MPKKIKGQVKGHWSLHSARPPDAPPDRPTLPTNEVLALEELRKVADDQRARAEAHVQPHLSYDGRLPPDIEALVRTANACGHLETLHKPKLEKRDTHEDSQQAKDDEPIHFGRGDTG